MNFNYLGIPQCDQANLNRALNSPDGSADCLSAVGPLPGAFATAPGLRTNADTAFGEDVQRGYKQKAFFTSVDYDVIPKVLTATGGIRFYHYDEFEAGSEYYSLSASGNFGQGLVVNHLNGQCTAAGLCGFPISLSRSESGHSWRGSLTWLRHCQHHRVLHVFGRLPSGRLQPHAIASGSTGRAAGAGSILGSDSTNQYARPTGYNSDNLVNNEVGFKSEFMDHHVLFNLSAYYMKWDRSSRRCLTRCIWVTRPLTSTARTIRSRRLRGAVRRADHRCAYPAGIELCQHSESVEHALPALSRRRPRHYGATANNPTPKGHCITQVEGAPFPNPFGQPGARLPFSPPWMFNLLARYDWTGGAYKRFAWVGASHIASMSNEPANFPDGNAPSENPPTGSPNTTLLRYQIPGYTTYDAGLGVAKNNWTAQIQCNNLTNTYGPAKIASDQLIKAEVPLRPRVITFLIDYRF